MKKDKCSRTPKMLNFIKNIDMIYIKRFLYLLFSIIMTILGFILMILMVLTYPFITSIDYIVRGKFTANYVMIVYDWLDDVLNKFKPE